jgi:hypothetical protein
VSAAALLREARAIGLDFEQVDGRWRITGKPDPDLRDRLRDNRVELIEVLTGKRCRWCAVRLAWPGPAGIVYADGTAECQPCGDAEVAVPRALFADILRRIDGLRLRSLPLPA